MVTVALINLLVVTVNNGEGGVTGSYNLIYIYSQSPVSTRLTDGWVQVYNKTQTFSLLFPFAA